jgi:hypothetical protein
MVSVLGRKAVPANGPWSPDRGNDSGGAGHATGSGKAAAGRKAGKAGAGTAAGKAGTGTAAWKAGAGKAAVKAGAGKAAVKAGAGTAPSGPVSAPSAKTVSGRPPEREPERSGTGGPAGNAGTRPTGSRGPGLPGRLATLLSILLFAASLSCASGPGLPARAQQPDALERALEQVKAEFEREAAGNRDPRAIQASSWKAVGLSFLEALAAMDTARYGEFRDRNTEEIYAAWTDDRTGWDHREIRAMRLCDEVWSRMAAIMAARDGSPALAQELEGVMTRHEVAAARARTEPARRAEARVFWSNRLAVTLPFLVEGLVPGQSGALDDIAEDLINNAEVVAERRDVHYQARMDLLYNNNVRGLAGMMFLALSQKGSPYLEDAAALRQAWDDSMARPDFKVSDKITHSLLTAAQLSFPMAHWLGSL